MSGVLSLAFRRYLKDCVRVWWHCLWRFHRIASMQIRYPRGFVARYIYCECGFNAPEHEWPCEHSDGGAEECQYSMCPAYFASRKKPSTHNAKPESPSVPPITNTPE